MPKVANAKLSTAIDTKNRNATRKPNCLSNNGPGSTAEKMKLSDSLKR